eukprot:CAMPEP_0181432146 /NCGR_PEP_ID=MMETSP1110-20121109/18616_1 /TAXON_ID=174948 /ORGANISM="Symbiodinium sp., Strain CCMP421" /LENGTH=73 /DNA_ID=CAMNT_0023555539 /DNA_START=309 /DNA_END=530 /DNA_ORIENTATION=-
MMKHSKSGTPFTAMSSKISEAWPREGSSQSSHRCSDSRNSQAWQALPMLVHFERQPDLELLMILTCFGTMVWS